MKKILLLIIVCLTFFFKSCQPNEATTQIFSTTVSDAAAGWQMYVETGGAMVSACGGPLTSLLQFGAVGVAAAVASGLFDRTSNFTPRIGKTGHSILPSQYIISDNPYEIIGIAHNKFLDKIAELGGIDNILEGILTWDSKTWDDILSSESSFDSTQGKLAQCGRFIIGENSLRDFYSKIQTTTYPEETFENIGVSQLTKDKAKVILEHYVFLKNQNSPISEITEFLNNQIIDLIRGYPELVNEDERGLIIFLTILKHSNYYWSE